MASKVTITFEMTVERSKNKKVMKLVSDLNKEIKRAPYKCTYCELEEVENEGQRCESCHYSDSD